MAQDSMLDISQNPTKKAITSHTLELIIQLAEWVHTEYALNRDPDTIPYFMHTYAYTYIHMYM